MCIPRKGLPPTPLVLHSCKRYVDSVTDDGSTLPVKTFEVNVVKDFHSSVSTTVLFPEEGDTVNSSLSHFNRNPHERMYGANGEEFW